MALVVAQAALEKFGGDSLAETRSNIERYSEQVAARLQRVTPEAI